MSSAAQKNHAINVLDLFKPYEHFCRSMLDAYVVVDADGHVLKSNQLFTQLVNKTSKQILKTASFDEMLSLYLNDQLISVKKLLEGRAPNRLDEVRGDNGRSKDLNLIIGYYPFADGTTNEFLGAFILLRDVTAETALQHKYRTTALKSITDPLTGLYTRGYFEDYLNLQMDALSQLPPNAEQRNLTLALVDIDFFKKVNDVHGHQAGDYVLKLVSGLMSHSFRKTDVVCRYGGEEFLVILPTTDLNLATIPVEKFRASVAAEEVNFEGTKFHVTVSCGLAQVKIGQEKYEATIARADEALYASKHNGRNRITVHNGVNLLELCHGSAAPKKAG